MSEEKQEVENKEKANIEKVIKAFLTKVQLYIGQAYTVNTEDVAKFWTEQLLKDSPQMTALQVKECAKHAFQNVISDLPSYKVFMVLSKIIFEVKDERKAIPVEDWEAHSIIEQ